MTKTTVAPLTIPRGKSAGGTRSPLYMLCYENLPDYRKVSEEKHETWHSLDTKRIAKEINVSYQKVSGWMQKNSLPGQRVNQMIGLKGSTLTYDKLGPFISSR